VAGDPLAMLMGGEGGGPEKPAASPKDDAAKDFLAAVKANDATALGLAFDRLYEACQGAEPADDEETDEDEEV
jgi:hypothetical protein